MMNYEDQWHSTSYHMRWDHTFSLIFTIMCISCYRCAQTQCLKCTSFSKTKLIFCIALVWLDSLILRSPLSSKQNAYLLFCMVNSEGCMRWGQGYSVRFGITIHSLVQKPCLFYLSCTVKCDRHLLETSVAVCFPVISNNSATRNIILYYNYYLVTE